MATDAFPTTVAGLLRAKAWIVRNATGQIAVAMEGTGSYGVGFARGLIEPGISVIETRPPKRASRRAGKSDPIDAELAARHLLSLPDVESRIIRAGSGDRAALQVLLTARRARTTERTATVNALTALLRTHGLGIDARHPLSPAQVHEITAWRPRRTEKSWQATIRAEAISLARAIGAKDIELASNLAGLTRHVTALAP